MDDTRVPITVFSFLPHSVVATPNDGVLYIGGAGGLKIGYIANAKADFPNIDHFHAFSGQTIRAIDCDPDWSENQQFAVLTSNNFVHVWDLSKREPVYGHRGLEKSSSSQSSTGAMCYLKTKKIMAVDCDRCVIFCTSSNTYSTSMGGALLKNHTITLLKACPYDSNLVAAGTKNGLILISNVSDLSILHKLRGHDSEITCIDWIKLNNNSSTSSKPISAIPTPTVSATPVRAKKVAKSQSRRKPQPIVDKGDMFDIFSFDYLENEFGTLSNVNSAKSNYQEEPKPQLNIQNNEGFDFVEACQSLKEDMLRPNNEEGDEDNEVHHSEIPELCTDGSSECHSDEFADVNDTVEEFDLEGRDNESPEIKSGTSATDKTLCIVSASREPFVWIWDLNSGAALEKIAFKSSQKASDIKFQGLTAKWLDETTLITNSPNGDLLRISVSLTDKKLTYKITEDIFKEKLIFNFALNRSTQLFWAVSLKRSIICTEIGNFDKSMIWYSTLAEKLHTIRESPHDMNKIAVAGKSRSIYIMDASNFSPHNMKTVVYANRIQAKVISIAWHPVSEKLLAFSTVEGRVGILDISKVSNVPVTMKPFTSEEVYTVSWGLITDKSNTSPHWVLFACSKTKLVYFPEKEKDAKHICEDKPISTVSAGKNWLSIGSQDGYVYILKLNGLEIMCSFNISNRYVSECAWNPNNQDILAASSDTSDIYLFDCTNAGNGEMLQAGVLKGHCKGGVPSLKWSNENEHRLLSTGFDGTVRVWDTKTLECMSLYQSRGPVFCATFWPKDENFVICSGFNESLYMYDTRNRMDEWNPKPIKDKPENVQWAALETTDPQQLITLERKVNRKTARKMRRGDISKLSESLKDVQLAEKTEVTNCEPTVNMELNHTTIFYLSSKEFNKKGIEILNEMLSEEEDEDITNRSLHRLLFSGKDDVKQLLDIELQNHKNSKTDSIGHVLIPQLNFNLETEINEFIATKKLTPQHVSLAPMISFTFWRKCCKALAAQYLEKNCTLLALPYLLAVHEINDAIQQLANAKLYREAWILAKVHKEPEDQILSEIANSWATFLEEHGNLDGAALVAFSVGKFEMAHSFLSKKRTKTESVEKMMKMLNKRV